MSKVKGKHRQHSKVNRRSKENSRKDGIHADEETGLEEHLENLSTNDIGKNICCLFYFLLYLVCTFDIGLLNVCCLNITFRIPNHCTMVNIMKLKLIHVGLMSCIQLFYF